MSELFSASGVFCFLDIAVLAEITHVLVITHMDYKTSLKCQFWEIEMYILSESGVNNLSIDVWFVRIGHYLAEIHLFVLKIWNLRVQRNINIEKIDLSCPN